MPTMLIIGATSDIAAAAALAFGREGWDIELAGRRDEAVAARADDLSVRLNRPVGRHHFDALDRAGREQFWDSLSSKPDAILCAAGLLNDQSEAGHQPALAEECFIANFSGLTPLLSAAADHFEARGRGLIIVISSVAGDRGRASNYIYGSAKAALTAYLSGLRNRLAGKSVSVITVKPGFVRTAMTEGLNLPGILTADPKQVAADMVRAVKKKKDVIYSRWFWRWIMLIIKAIPEAVFKKMNI